MRNILSMPAEMGNEKLGQIILLNSVREYSNYDMKVVKQLSELLALAINRTLSETVNNEKNQVVENPEVCIDDQTAFWYNGN